MDVFVLLEIDEKALATNTNLSLWELDDANEEKKGNFEIESTVTVETYIMCWLA